MRILGFMSGTSLDGVDAAIIDTDGETVHGFGPTHLASFTPQQRAVIKTLTEQIVASGASDPGLLGEADTIMVDVHVQCAKELLAQPDAGKIDLIGYHGQTVLHRPDPLHRPEQGLTIQIGDPAKVASALGIDVVADVRQADIAAGGEGAPLVPVYHAALVSRVTSERPVAFLNVGGVANFTFIGADGQLIGLDTGPGNGMLDLTMQMRGLGRYDDGGVLSSRGMVHQAIVDGLMSHAYFSRKGPKSLDRYDFPLDVVAHLDDADAAATLVAFTAQAVAWSARTLPEKPKFWIVCGGGRHNPAIMRALSEQLGTCVSADDLGLRGDFIEAEAIAFIAARHARGLPVTFPATTGTSSPTPAGKLYKAPVEELA
jgi:anhydro-N-acetylmuramic acid kinase